MNRCLVYFLFQKKEDLNKFDKRIYFSMPWVLLIAKLFFLVQKNMISAMYKYQLKVLVNFYNFD